LDVDLLVRPHRRAGFVHGDGHLFVLVDLYEYNGGRHTAEIHGRAGPIEQYGLDRAAISTPIGKTHEAVSCMGSCRLYTIYNESNSVSSCTFRDDVSSRQGSAISERDESSANFTHRAVRREIITICLSHALGVTFFGCSSILEGE